MEYRKKLIEVALPLEAINVASAREKSIRHGHPSTLHLWWARRPLAACRAVLFASLVDDPSSDPMFGGDEEIEASKRAELFNLIEELVLWENSNNPRVINKARAEIARCIASRKIETDELKKDQAIALPSPSGRGAAGEGGSSEKSAPKTYTPHDIKHMLAPPEAVDHFLANYGPPVLDPFCGGGSIPLEAQRLGLRAYGSDLNPVAVLITKALIEIPPKFAGMPPVNPEWQKKSQEEKAARVWHGAQGLAEDVRYYGKWMRDEAEKRIGHHYPKVTITKEMAQDRPDLKEYVGQDLTVIAWLWARTVECPNPGCKSTLPLVSSWSLSSRKSNMAIIEPIIRHDTHRVDYQVRVGTIESGPGTVGRRGATCLFCNSVIPFDHIRSQGVAGHMGQQLMAIVAEGPKGRVFLPPLESQAKAASCSLVDGLGTDLPQQGLGFRVQKYGLTKHRDLFSPRQLTAISAFSDAMRDIHERILADAAVLGLADAARTLDEDGDGRRAYADAVLVYLALAISKATDLCSSLCHWQPNPEHLKIAPTFMRPTLSMTWDFAEGNPFSDSSGNFGRQPELVQKVLEGWCQGAPGHVSQLDARTPHPESRQYRSQYRSTVLRQHRLCRPQRFLLCVAPPNASAHCFRTCSRLCWFPRVLNLSLIRPGMTIATQLGTSLSGGWKRLFHGFVPGHQPMIL